MSADRAAQLVEAGVWLRMTGDHAGARQLFEKALLLDPSNARARQLLEEDSPGQAPPPPKPNETLVFGRGQVPTPYVPTPAYVPSTTPPPYETSAWDTGTDPGLLMDQVQPVDHGAMELAGMPTPAPAAPVAEAQGHSDHEFHALLGGAKDLLELDDHSGAMDLLGKAEKIRPNDPELLALKERSELTLLSMLESRLGDLSRAPRVALKEDEIIWLNLDHRAGFVLAQIDGSVSFDDLFAVCGMSRIDTARILAQLIDEGVIR